MMNIKLIYPEERVVTEEQIRTWHADKVADGDISMPAPGETVTLADMIWDLEDLGLITVAESEFNRIVESKS